MNDQVKRLPGEPDEQQLNAWQQQYGQGKVIRLEALPDEEGDDAEGDDAETAPLVVYCRKPNPQHMARFTQGTQKDAYKAIRDLVLDCRLWPDAETLKSRLDDRPGLALGIGGELQRLIGSTTSFSTRRF